MAGNRIAFLFFCGILLGLPQHGDGTCTFPTALQTGTWYSNEMGTVTFTSSQFTVSSIIDFGSQTFDCMEFDGTNYFLISQQFVYLGANFKLAMCFQLTQDSDYKFYYYLLSSVLASTDVQRIKFNIATYNFTAAETCEIATPTFTNARVFLRSGFINETASTCSTPLLGTFSYSVSGSSCSSTYLDVCNDTTMIDYDYTLCSDKMMFSDTGKLSCVWSGTSNSMYYTLVYNEDTTTDESTYYRFSCVASEISGNSSNSTVYPRACPETLTSTSVSSPGYAIEKTANYTCPITTTVSTSTTTTTTTTATTTVITAQSVSSAGTIIAVVIGLGLLIGSGLIGGLLYYFKIYRKKKVNPKGDEMLPSRSPPLDTQDDSKLKESDGRVSPFTPYPTVSELATYRFGPSEIDDDDGGMTLGATTPGITDGRRPLWNDQGSRTSLPMYSEIGGETPDPTRLSEVQTSMSERTLFETNLADFQPFTMTRATMNVPSENTVSPMGTPDPDGNGADDVGSINLGDVTL